MYTQRSCLGLWEKEDVDVGEDTTGGDSGSAHELGELFIVADGELDVSWDNSALLVILGGVACELEDLSREVLEDGSEVHGGTGTNALSVAALLHETGDPANGELESSLGRAANGASSLITLASSSFASGHCVLM